MTDSAQLTAPVDDPIFPASGGGQYSSSKNIPVAPEDHRQTQAVVQPIVSNQSIVGLPGQAQVAVVEEEKKVARPVFWVILILVEVTIAIGGSILVLTSRG
ncbi:hypothetical protein A3H21_04725 [Candidatus Woesebacteria bacterium RIFCSPLOWO2_12_FULL_42_8]|nr:MAG: hypothetical protein A3H21_04725 [Candidatus Woesebacteria bacterium RIFCSPLOWO2_12_FULL_42_8]